MYVVGVTGGIGSGKTTVTNLFQTHGIDVVDADVIARSIFQPGSDALLHVQERFGDRALLETGELNRAWLRERVFTHPEDKAWLNQLTHPLIREQILAALKQAQSPYVILSAPLLVENKLTALCDRVLVVDVTEAMQIERTRQRDDVSAQQVSAIMQAQASRIERLQAADDVLDNNGTPEALVEPVERLHRFYLQQVEQQLQLRDKPL
ncbi:dephospho-CoA kinase [Pseudidiomarina aestuarii]|uniref:Dephospho-CoA kinase n=1 Tax=Pseudidiomarina aestuarii TaxID=624146 RepID=A0A7Z6ZV08_9GAMM|nr:dephospho-CoA kinase [Pseudidiomarina aestuarii]RUO41762.1 dephospho-CoA kinase [Pseudidiomarina aestuarii]